MKSAFIGGGLALAFVVVAAGLGWILHVTFKPPPLSCTEMASRLHSRCMVGVTEGDAIRACSELLESERDRCKE